MSNSTGKTEFDIIDLDEIEESERIGHRERFTSLISTYVLLAILIIGGIIVYVNRENILSTVWNHIDSGIENLDRKMVITSPERAFELSWLNEADMEYFLRSEDFKPSELTLPQSKVGVRESFITAKGGAYNQYYGVIEYEFRDYTDGHTYRRLVVDSQDPLRALQAIAGVDRGTELYSLLDYGYSVNINTEDLKQVIGRNDNGQLLVEEERQ